MKKIILAIILCFVLTVPSIAEDSTPTESSFISPNMVSDEQSSQPFQLEGGVFYDENDGTVFLNKSMAHPVLNIKPANTLIPVYTPSPNSIYESKLSRTRSALSSSSRLSGEEYYIAPTSHSLSDKIGNFSYGSYYGTSLDSAQLLYSTTFFTRYDSKHFAFTTGVGTDSGSTNGMNTNTFSFSPEWKITKSLAVKDTMRAYMGVPVKKNQISIVYTPQMKKYIDTLKFELGISQSFYENGVTNSAVQFSTNFRL